MAYTTSVVEFDAGIGKEYLVGSYATPGIYYNARLNTTFILAGTMIYSLANFKFEATPSTNIDIDPYKLLAIALYKEAALEAM
jgi:hypothetical protein